MKDKQDDSRKVVATNRRALAKYHVLESVEAGLALTGPEVKSVRAGRINLQDGFARFDESGATLWNVHISPYAQGSTHVEQNPTRRRTLLLKAEEIRRWMGKTTVKGLTVVPLEVYFNKRGFAKVRLGLAKNKGAPDRREELRRKTVEREVSRAFAGRKRIR